MQLEAIEIRAQVEALSTRGAGNRYPAELRRRAADYAARARQRGHTSGEAAEAVGVPWPTLKRWMEAEPVVAGFSRVVVADPGPSSLTLVTPSGCRIEGLSVEQAADLVRRL